MPDFNFFFCQSIRNGNGPSSHLWGPQVLALVTKARDLAPPCRFVLSKAAGSQGARELAKLTMSLGIWYERASPETLVLSVPFLRGSFDTDFCLLLRSLCAHLALKRVDVLDNGTVYVR